MGNKTIITRQELYDLLWKESLTAISKRLNIPYTHLRRVCAEMNVPVPQNGYWSKLQFNKPVEVIELPQDYTGTNEIKLFPDGRTTSNTKVLTFHKKSAADLIREDKTLALTVPKTLANPDELIVKAKKQLEEYSFNTHHDHGMVRYEGAFVIRVSRRNIGRALRFMDTLIKLIRSRGHNIELKYTHSLSIDTVSCEFKLMEKTKKSDQLTKWGSAQYESTGQLYFEIKGFGGRIWIDGKVLIEEKLAEILVKIESEVSEMLECWRQNALRKQEREEKERIIREQQQRIEKEKSDFKDLYQQAKRWKRARYIRDYIKAIKDRALEQNELTEDLQNWINWASKKVDLYDPFVKKGASQLNKLVENKFL